MIIERNYFLKVISLASVSKAKLFFMPLYYILLSILDLISIGLIGAYISLVVNEDFIINDKFDSALNFWSQIVNIDSNIVALGILLVLIFITKSILASFIHWQVISFTHTTQANLRRNLMLAYRKMNYSDYLKKDSSVYITAVGTLVKNYGGGLLACIQCLGDIIIAAVIVSLLAIVNGIYLLFLISFLLAIVILYKIFFLDELDKYGKKLNQSYGHMYQAIAEYFFGFKELKILNSFYSFEKRIIDATGQIASSDVRQSFITTIPRFILELILIIFIISIVSFAIFFGENIQSTLPVITVFAAASLRLIPIAYQFTKYIGSFKYSEDSINKLYADLNNNNLKEITNNLDIEFNQNFEKIEFSNVSFTYNKQKNYMLQNINFKIKKGEAIAITGPSGSGKTTLINLMLGLIEPIEGNIIYNQKKISEAIDTWRSQVAYLPQETFLINDTIKANIALGVDPNQIDEIKIHECINKVYLSDFINDLKDGVNTNVSERGLAISGGQRQRIAFARAFYFNRNILILDEPTSSLDQNTEKEITGYLSQLKKSKTIIIISHKPDSIKFCDHIYEIKNNTMEKK